MKVAGPQAKFMHCLPAERGVECTDGVMESGTWIIAVVILSVMYLTSGHQDQPDVIYHSLHRGIHCLG